MPGFLGDREDGVFFQYEKPVRVIEPSIISMVVSMMTTITRLLIVRVDRSFAISPGMLDVLIIMNTLS